MRDPLKSLSPQRRIIAEMMINHRIRECNIDPFNEAWKDRWDIKFRFFRMEMLYERIYGDEGE